MMDDDFAVPDSIDSSEYPTRPQHGLGLIVAALILPVIVGVVECFVTSFWVALVVSGAMVLITAILIAVDASRLGQVDLKGKVRESPLLLFMGLCLLWIIVYPVAMFRRHAFGGPNLGFLGLLVAIFAVGVPFVPEMLAESDLPACDSAEVIQIVDQIVRESPVGPQVKSIDKHRQIRFDPQANVRYGECVLHMAQEETPVPYIVEWLNRSAGQFQVRIPEPELPGCDDPQVVQLLEKIIRDTMPETGVKSIDGHRETYHDVVAGLRQCECVVHGDGGDIPVKYVVEWQDHKVGQLYVRLANAVLPSCSSPQVARMVDTIVRKRWGDSVVKSIDGYRETSFDREADQRWGECVVHTDKGDQSARFVVKWTDRPSGRIQVLVLDNNLPLCTSTEVAQIMETLVRGSLEGATLKTIDGYREISFDPKKDVRHGVCVIHTDKGDMDVEFFVEWQDRDAGMFQVVLPEAQE